MIWIKNSFFCVLTLSTAGSFAYLVVYAYRRIISNNNYALDSIWLKLIACLYITPIIYVSLLLSKIRYVDGVWIKFGELYTGLPVVITKLLNEIGWIWFIGVVLQIVPIVYEWIRIQHVIAGNVPVESDAIQRVFAEYLTLPAFRNVKIYANDMVSVPFTVGIIRPIVIVPYCEFDERQARIMIGHEMNHILHKDMFWKQLCLLVKWVHWFNPFVHWLLRQIVFEMEVICDFCTILHNPFYTKKDYSIFLAEMCDDDFSNVTMSALCESKNEVFRRIQIMAKQDTIARVGKFVAITSCMILTIIALLPTYLISASAANMQSDAMRNIEDIKLDIENAGYNIEYIGIADDGVTEIMVSQDDIEPYSGLYSLNFTIPVGIRILYKYQRMTTGQLVSTISNCADSNAVYRVGLKNVNNWNARYIEGSGQMSHTFTVFEDDLFCVFVENMMNYPIDIIGSYIYP